MSINTTDTAEGSVTRAPFKQYALTLYDSGLGEVFPIRPDTKKPVNWDKPADGWEWGARTPDGKRHSVHGRNHPPITRDHVEQWAEEFPGHMLGLVPAPTVVVVDIDQHDEKHGAEALAKALGISRKELGLLLKRTLHVSGRKSGTGWQPAHGHWYFTVPDDVRLKRHPAKDVDVIGPGRQGFYVVAPGSVHPATGRTYVADVAGVERSIEWLSVDPIQPMPQPLLDLLRDDRERTERPGGGGLMEDAEQYARDPQGEPDEAVAEVLTAFLDDPGDYADQGSHHGSAMRVQIDLAHLAESGHPGVWTALAEAAEVAEGYFEFEGRGGEWDRLLEGVSVDLERMAYGAKTGDYAYCPPVTVLRGADGKPIQGAAQKANAERPSERPITQSEGDDESVELLWLSEVEPEQVEWLYKPLINGEPAYFMPLGMLTVLAGQQGVGKSNLAYDIAARITQGTLDGRLKGEPGNVLVVFAEESVKATIVPRLMAAGADRSKVATLRVRRKNTTSPPDLGYHLEEIAKVVREHNIKLILIDPITSRMNGKDQFKDSEVREVLEPFCEMLAETGCSALGLIHFNKSGTQLLTRVMNSTAFTSVPRSVLAVQRDPEEASRVLLSQVKANAGPQCFESKSYTVQTAYVTHNGERFLTSRIAWGDDDPRSGDDIDREHKAREKATPGEAKKTVAEQVAEWMLQHLCRTATGADTRQSIFAAGDAERGFTTEQLKRGLKFATDDDQHASWVRKVPVVFADDGSVVPNNVVGYALTYDGVAYAKTALTLTPSRLIHRDGAAEKVAVERSKRGEQ